MICILFVTPLADWGEEEEEKKVGITDNEMPLEINCRPKPKFFQ